MPLRSGWRLVVAYKLISIGCASSYYNETRLFNQHLHRF
jgi:hypothetical protein